MLFSSTDNSDPRTNAHCCGSEALSIPATFALLGAAASIIRGASYSGFIVYGAALLAAVGSRHLNVIFAVWLPLTLIGVALIDKPRRFRTDEKARNWAKTAGVAFLIGTGVSWLNDWMAKSMIVAFHDEYRSTLGWTLSDRVRSFLVKIPSEERLQFARNLALLVTTIFSLAASLASLYPGPDQPSQVVIDLGKSREPFGS